jgi:hypothetical protein
VLPDTDGHASWPGAIAAGRRAQVSARRASLVSQIAKLGTPVAPAAIIARALTGAADAIAWPETLAPCEEDDDELSIFDGELDPPH